MANLDDDIVNENNVFPTINDDVIEEPSGDAARHENEDPKNKEDTRGKKSVGSASKHLYTLTQLTFVFSIVVVVKGITLLINLL